MDKPTCRLCGGKHYGTEHIWDKQPSPGQASVKPPVKPVAEPPKPAKSFDRVAYQREYMREWRKRKK